MMLTNVELPGRRHEANRSIFSTQRPLGHKFWIFVFERTHSLPIRAKNLNLNVLV